MRHLNDATTLEAALAYAARGWPVYPVAGTGSDPLDMRDDDKRFGLGSLDPDQIREWFTRAPSAGVAIKTGAERGHAGIFALSLHGDVDAKLDAIATEHGPMPGTLAARSSTGGLYLYFAANPGDYLQTGHRDLAPGARATVYGGCWGVVAPPVDAKGKRCEWLNDLEPATPPEWLARIVAEVRPFPEAWPRRARLRVLLEWDAGSEPEPAPEPEIPTEQEIFEQLLEQHKRRQAEQRRRDQAAARKARREARKRREAARKGQSLYMLPTGERVPLDEFLARIGQPEDEPHDGGA